MTAAAMVAVAGWEGYTAESAATEGARVGVGPEAGEAATVEVEAVATAEAMAAAVWVVAAEGSAAREAVVEEGSI